MVRAGADSLVGVLRKWLDEQDDDTLLERFVRFADEAAFEGLVRRYGPMVLRVCRRGLSDATEAEDVFQATFLVLARKANQLGHGRALGAWLHRVAHRVAGRARRTAWRQQALAHSAVPAGPSLAAIDTASQRELVAVVDEEVQGLTENYRAPLVLCHLLGLKREEAARQLGWPVATLKLRLRQGRAALRRRLERRGLGTLAGAALPIGLPRVPLPPALPASTAHSATLFFTGRAGGIAAPSRAAQLALEVLRMSTRIAVVRGTVAWALLLLVLGVGVLALGPAWSKPDDAPVVIGPAPAVEDPLPEGALKRLGTIRFRHDGPIEAVQFSADGKSVATVGVATAYRWEAATGKCLAQFPIRRTPKSSNNSVFSADGKTLAITSGNEVLLYDASTGKELRKLEGAKDLVQALAFSPDGASLAATSRDKAIYLWDTATGKANDRIEAKDTAPNSVTWGPNGKALAYACGPDIRLWDVAGKKEVRGFEAPGEAPEEPLPPGFVKGQAMAGAFANGPAYRLTMSPDGKFLCATDWHAGQPTILWDVSNGKVIHRLKTQASVPFSNLGAYSAVFSADGKTLAVVRGDKSVVLWDVATGKEVRRLGDIAAQSGGSYGYATTGVPIIAFSPDGKTIAGRTLYDNVLRTWDTATGKEFSGDDVGHDQAISGVALSRDGKTLASFGPQSRGSTVLLWDVATGRRTHGLRGQGTEGLSAAALSPDGKVLATGGTFALRLSDAATGKERRQVTAWFPEMFATLNFSPDGKVLATTTQGGRINLRDAASLQSIRELTSAAGPDGRFASMVLGFSPDGNILVTRLPDASIHLCDSHTGKELRSCKWPIPEKTEGELKDSLATAQVFGTPPTIESYFAVSGVAFAPDGRTFAAFVQGLDTSVCVFETATAKLRLRVALPPGQTEAIALSPDGKLLATGGIARDNVPPDHAVHLWDTLTGKEVGQLPGHIGAVTALAFSADGKVLVSGSADTTLLVWDASRLKRPMHADHALSPEMQDALWSDLGSDDGLQAQKAIAELVAAGAPGAEFLTKKLEPAKAADPARLDRLLADLENKDFTIRNRAAEELEGLGELADPAYRKLLAGQPTLDVRQRVDQLRDRARNAPTGAILRDMRAVEALERSGTPEARALLARLAEGAEAARLTREAREAKERGR